MREFSEEKLKRSLRNEKVVAEVPTHNLYIRISGKTPIHRELKHTSKLNASFATHRHINARACCLWTWVRWLANCCCWWANVCFIRTILMLCSIAYFLALVTVSCCSLDRRGKDPPNMPSNAEREPGPNFTSPDCLISVTGAEMNGIFGFQSGS